MKVTQTPLTFEQYTAILTYDCITSCCVHTAAKQKDEKDTAFVKRIIATYAEIAGRAALSAEIDLVIGGTKPESSMSKTSLDEQIANALVENAVNDGFLISVNTGRRRSSTDHGISPRSPRRCSAPIWTRSRLMSKNGASASSL